ncbi:hypothetical protein [Ensifer sp. 4252]|uniref:hypothetical protein n=1 Tax=Ensifer sp. 4252 TaxID=3373915 RepID=UPI003D204FAE
MFASDTKSQFGRVVKNWNTRYDLEEFIAASGLPPLEAREIFAKHGPYKVDLDHLIRARTTIQADSEK